MDSLGLFIWLFDGHLLRTEDGEPFRTMPGSFRALESFSITSGLRIVCGKLRAQFHFLEISVAPVF